MLKESLSVPLLTRSTGCCCCSHSSQSTAYGKPGYQRRFKGSPSRIKVATEDLFIREEHDHPDTEFYPRIHVEVRYEGYTCDVQCSG